MIDILTLYQEYVIKQEKLYHGRFSLSNRLAIKGFINFINEKRGIKIASGNRIAMITEEIGNLTGGRYYMWFLAMALVELGFDVTIYTNQVPVYRKYFTDYKLPKIIIVNKQSLSNIDIEADIYISSPLQGNLALTRLRDKYRKPCYAMIFDPLPMMDKLAGFRYAGWETLENKLRLSDLDLICLTDITGKYTAEWLKRDESKVHTVYPCINSRELSKVINTQRKDYVVFISRLVSHKNFDHVLEAVKKTGVKLRVISSVNSATVQRQVRLLGMSGQVSFHIGVDDRTKFEILSGALAVVSASTFEGFGMWASEAVATGTPLVCYEFPTIREIQKISGVDNFYYAEPKNIKDLTKKLLLALKEAKFEPRNKTFDFEEMVERVKYLFKSNVKIGVITIALNEQKYIGASLRSIIKNPLIKKVAVVEGADRLFCHGASNDGLSVDNTSKEVMKAMSVDKGNKIVYERYGWASGKAELRNKALSLLGKNITHILVVDADEVWDEDNLDRLITHIKKNQDRGVFYFNFRHFWKKPNLVATGSNWNLKLFRCFKFQDKSLHWERHEMPVVNFEGKGIDRDGTIILDDVFVHHYGYLKDSKDIVNKIEYYKKRDKNYKVVDTWSDWREGLPTSTTHGQGSVLKFTGEHPVEVRKIL